MPATALRARAWSRSAAGTCRSSTRGIIDRAHGRPRRAPASSTSATWARSKSPARTRSPRSSGSRRNDASQAAGRAGAVLRPADAAGHVRRRPARLPAGAEPLPARRQRRQHRERLRAGSPSRSRASATRSPSTRAPATRCIALQGPEALDVLQPLTGVDLGGDEVLLVRARRGRQRARHGVAHRLYRRGRLRDLRAAGSRPTSVWLALLESGRSADVIPCGLGARDTLRLEAGMRLHGNDIDETTTAARSRPELDRRLEERRLHRRRARCASRKRPASGARSSASRCSTAASRRHGYDVYVGDAKAGIVTSGTQTPFLKKAIGMAYLPIEHTGARVREFDVDIRGRRTRARVVPMPFYKRVHWHCRPTCAGDPMAYPADLKYTKDHEWIDLTGDTRRGRHHRLRPAAARRRRLRRVAGSRAQRLKQGQSFGTIESVKAVSELYSPVTGEVIEVNAALKDKPEGGQQRTRTTAG